MGVPRLGVALAPSNSPHLPIPRRKGEGIHALCSASRPMLSLTVKPGTSGSGA